MVILHAQRKRAFGRSTSSYVFAYMCLKLKIQIKNTPVSHEMIAGRELKKIYSQKHISQVFQGVFGYFSVEYLLGMQI
jgi:hypothetical protein